MSSSMRESAPIDGDDPIGADVYAGKAFPPAARLGDYVYLSPLDLNFRIESIRAIGDMPALSSDNGNEVTLTANAKSDKVEVEELKLDDGELAQWRPLKLGVDLPADVRVYIDQLGRQMPLFQTKNHRGYWTRETGVEIGHDGTNAVANDDFISSFLELWQFEDRDLFMQFEETGGATPTIDGLRFSGYIYELSEEGVISSKRRAIPVPVGPQD